MLSSSLITLDTPKQLVVMHINTPSHSKPLSNDILLVDDFLESLKLLTNLLTAEGYNVRPTDDPSLALESALENPPELILLDIKMPQMDGFGLCRLLKQDKRTAHIPVIFISVLQDAAARIRAFNVGGVDFISKPILREDLLSRISTHLELHRMRQSLTTTLMQKKHQVKLDERRFEALYELSQMRDSSEDELAAYALESAVEMTCSEIGYLHFVEQDQQHIDLYKWSQKTMKQCTAEPTSHYPLEEAGIWADCVRINAPVIHNDYPSQAEKKGLPEGHFPLQRHMSVPIHHEGKVVAIIGVGNKELPYNDNDARQLNLFGGSMWSIINEIRNSGRLKNALVQTIQAIAMTLEQRDPYTAGHQRGVSALAGAIAQEMGLDSHRVEGIRLGGMIHDIGKIHIPSEILNRPGKLSEIEFNIIKTHPKVGYEIVKGVDFPWQVANLIHQHHERLDGSGYPQGLKGDQICIGARVLAVADVVDAMATHRPYRPALPLSIALEEIERGSDQIYDKKVAKACLRLFREKGYKLEDN
ncbi:MAG: HD domain-containing phosphohydrolase [Sedimenticola sp.]